MIASLSGVRGILNVDITLADVTKFAGNFAGLVESSEVLVARDSRSTGPLITRAVASSIMSQGVDVVDYGIISTPALFRESRLLKKPAVMVTASHNEPEFNGLKFIVDGKGIGKEALERTVAGRDGTAGPFGMARIRQTERTNYVDDLVGRYGEGALEGISVALDLGGGAAISHSIKLLKRLGCRTVSVNDAYGVFNRKVDPVADELQLLRRVVKKKGYDMGMGFDCDGDRLVIVDSEGSKKSGDYMLTLAMKEMLSETGEKNAVVSQDTTQAIEDVVGKAGGQVFRSKVGEANVVAKMQEEGVRLGGEGSSGGLIDGDFNYCRDSMLASLVILKALKREGRRMYGAVPSYHQARTALRLPRAKAVRGIRKLAGKYEDADSTDGTKIRLSKRSWVLLRPSGTEELVRVSAEAETPARAEKIAKTFSAKIRELSR